MKLLRAELQTTRSVIPNSSQIFRSVAFTDKVVYATRLYLCC